VTRVKVGKHLGRFAVFKDGQLHEGGFFSRQGAVQAADTLTAELQLEREQQLERFKDALYQVYNNIGPDSGWTTKTPSNAEFVAVLCDQVHCQHDWNGKPLLSAEDRRAFSALPHQEKRRLCLEVGP
jgi:hypothetical protein